MAPDLVGMGESGESSSGYRFVDHRRYLDAWFDAVVGDQPVFLVLHDWGSGLGFHWAHGGTRSRSKGIAYMEAIVRPLAELGRLGLKPRARSSRRSGPPAGEEVILQKNVFVERILPSSIIREP